ncbi:MAG: hypothetical protein MUF81_14970 [Verrucomicrobia bacterium]|jgi:integrase|nr:hypothetical protein [Verrucomicrobiota bacterium]
MKTTFEQSKNRWRVSYQVNARQRRKFFRTKEDADTFAADRREDVKQFGVPWATITPNQRAEIQIEVERLKRNGWTLRAAVDFTLEHGKAPPALPLKSIAEQCLRAKEAKGCRPRSLRKLRTTIDRFLVGRRDRPACEITSAEIHEFLTRNGWRPATAKSFLIDLRTLFSFGVRNKLCRDNPALFVELPRLEDKPPGILTPAQSGALIQRCRVAETTLLATLALCLFAGVRPEEAHRLAWEDVGPDFVEIKAHKAKTRRRRLVTITPQLRAWLDLARAVKSELPAANHAAKFNRVRRLAGLFKDWPHDAMRHSFASYHMAKHRNENTTAQEMGNSPTMIYHHYRELVRPADAEAFFNIMPGDAAAATVQERPAKPMPRQRRVTAAILGEMFQHGARSLTKQDAVALLCDEHGFAPSTAYLVLKMDGAFAAHLREHRGKLSWTAFPQAEAAEPPLPDLPDVAAIKQTVA